MDTHWLAWAAGIVDGEGCIQSSHQVFKSGHELISIYLTVGNTDVRVMKKFEELFGGKVRITRITVTGKTAYEWRAGCKETAEILNILLPWLIVKKEQAELAILSRQYIGRGGAYRRSVSAFNELKRIHGEIKGLKHNSSSISIEQNTKVMQ